MQAHVEAGIGGATAPERLGGAEATSVTAFTLVAVLAATVPLAAQASPSALTAADVRALVTRPDCGGVNDRTPEGAALRERMVAKFRQESGFYPFAIRIEDERRGITAIVSKEEAVAEAIHRLARGQTLGLGLGQITGIKNLLADFGTTSLVDAVRLAFDACANVRASVRHYAGNLSYVMRVMDCASGLYNTGKFTCDTAYVRSVRALQAALPADRVRPLTGPVSALVPSPSATPRPPAPPPATVELLLPVVSVPRPPNPESPR